MFFEESTKASFHRPSGSRWASSTLRPGRLVWYSTVSVTLVRAGYWIPRAVVERSLSRQSSEFFMLSPVARSRN